MLEGEIELHSVLFVIRITFGFRSEFTKRAMVTSPHSSVSHSVGDQKNMALIIDVYIFIRHLHFAVRLECI